MTNQNHNLIKAMFSTLANRFAERQVISQRNVIEFNLPDPEKEGWASFDEVKKIAKSSPKQPTPLNPYLVFVFAFFFSAFIIFAQNTSLLSQANTAALVAAKQILDAVPAISSESLAYHMAIIGLCLPVVALYQMVLSRTLESIKIFNIFMMTLGIAMVLTSSMMNLEVNVYTLFDFITLKVAALFGIYWKVGNYTHILCWCVAFALSFPAGFYHAKLRKVSNVDYEDQEARRIDANFFFKSFIEGYDRWFEANHIAQVHFDACNAEEVKLSKLINRIVKMNQIEVLEGALAAKDGNTFWKTADHLIKELLEGVKLISKQAEELGLFHQYVLNRESSFPVVDARHALLFNKALEPQVNKLTSFISRAIEDREMFLSLERLNKEIAVEFDGDMFKEKLKEIASDTCDVLTVLRTHIDGEAERTAFGVSGDSTFHKDEVDKQTSRVKDHLNWATV